ncbi:acyl-CoA synthetase (AMP-forming)/AMP-acid ligase II [Litoreibacter ponti]|uniref:Acyl-CoA synthetase (AMP-forming)/AMP-acid ligase II n=1 Tax=Litoreibacter ponti TaxID=1510457 RepID=A0A2T6BM72_9RHOB|nr:AMP-binding protein [Litoreibacter ponti]PTX57087.1 acyl-CoA synthetase (AMP-forming)/AMP-acid ligase II [Litoreibacter ponti]
MIATPAYPPEGTVRDWLDARATGGETAIVFPETGESLGWRELRDTAKLMAQGLYGLGLSKGESVAIIHPNGRAAVLALYAALYGGFRATMINLAAGRDAIAYALEHSGARFAFVDDSQADTFAAAAPANLRRLDPSALQGGGTLPDLASDDHALLMYTSGTTGKPKGVVHTHGSLLAGGWTAAIAHVLTPEDRGFCVLPIYHINGLCVTVMGALVSGGSLAMVSRFSSGRFWDQADAAGVTWFSVVPTIISHLLHGEARPSDGLRARLRFGRSASSALAVDTQQAFETRFGVPIVETMGLTETAAQILSNPLPPGTRKVGSPGVAFGNEVRILTGDLDEARRGTEGEIAIRGPNVMREYLNNPQATAETFAGDWLRTGDLGRMDADGYVFVTGRLKELIIKGGENIAPREIDEVLYSHPDVVEAAAFARPCARYGETVEAAVALRRGARLGPDDLIALCKERLGVFKSPDVIHRLDELPKGPSGKIQRMKLSDLIAS